MSAGAERRRRRGLGGLVDRGRGVRPLVKAAQWGLTGGYVRRLNALLAEDIRRGPHELVLELGCGEAPVLGYLDPARYFGIDFNRASIEIARRKHGGPAAELIEADITSTSLASWRGADAVVCSALFHHLADEQLVELLERIVEEVGPSRIVCTDGVDIGPLRHLIAWLDEGDPSRPKADLYALLEPRFEVRETWTFEVPLRTVHVFGFVLTPR